MAREISLTEDELNDLEKKVQAEKDNLPADEAQLLEALLNKAKHERENSDTAGLNWYFSWTYSF